MSGLSHAQTKPDTTKAVADTAFHLGKIVAHFSIDVSCDSPIHNCDSIQAIRDPCFREYIEDKHNQEDCQTGAKNCTVEFKVLPILVNSSDIHLRPHPADRLWLFLLLTFQFIIIVYLRVAFFKNIEDTIKAYFNINLAQQLFREQEPSQPFSAFLLNANFIISFTVFAYLLVKYFINPAASPIALLTLIFLFIVGVYLGKYLLMRLTAWIFPFGDEMNFYAFNFFINQKLVGVLLIPLNSIIAYSPGQFTKPVIFISITMLLFTLAARSLRGMVIGRNYFSTNKFHFIVYICTLEIAPVLIIIKLIIRGLH